MAKSAKTFTQDDLEKPFRTTYITTVGRQEKLRYIAFVERKDITALLNEAADEMITKFEKKNGEIQIK